MIYKEFFQLLQKQAVAASSAHLKFSTDFGDNFVHKRTGFT
ncbi:hypothetical protein CPter91_3860 [Collimonas pratensis]|uniref:Uncharacterized protein n=1 Tax=Collimonas pratensis TaxID=279113 RepID=A0A127Q856_9BURK|nr:hypothetical protein CPter91_3860 [Collimonas pratensis]